MDIKITDILGSAIQMDHLDNWKKFNYSDYKIPSCNLKNKIIVGYSNDDLSNVPFS